MTRHIEGFGETLPTHPAERALALKRLMEQRDEKARQIHEKLKARYVEPGKERTSETLGR